MSDLPLFPLPDTVVFPGMTVPLLVFEERYKELVRVCLEMERPRFVISLDRGGGGLDDGAPPLARAGGLMDLLEVAENPDGTFNVVAHGQERIRLELARTELVAQRDGEPRPLHFVRDEPWPLERGDPSAEMIAAWDALETFRAYAAAFFPPDAERRIEEAMPDDPLFQASFLCANVRVPAASRQVLLEAPSLERRFALVQSMMKERIDSHRPPEQI